MITITTETPLQPLKVGMPLGLYRGPFRFLSTVSPLDSHLAPCLYTAETRLNIQITSLLGCQIGIFNLTFQNPSPPKTRLSHNILSKWDLHPPSYSVQKPWAHPWRFHFSYVPCSIHLVLLCLPWKHALHLPPASITPRTKPTPALAWIRTKPSGRRSLLCTCIPQSIPTGALSKWRPDLVTSLLKPLQWLLTSSE